MIYLRNLNGSLLLPSIVTIIISLWPGIICNKKVQNMRTKNM